MQVPVDTLNGLLRDKDALQAVLLRHVVPGTAMQGKNTPPGSPRTVEEVADAELAEKFSVLCGALVTHQDVGVNLQHNVKSS